jgi:RNA polymerase sigma factor (sigma-70 family)
MAFSMRDSVGKHWARSQLYYWPDIPARTQNQRDELEHRELMERLWQKVLMLDEPIREVVRKHYFYGRSVRQIALELHIPVMAVYKRLSRGRQEVQYLMGGLL